MWPKSPTRGFAGGQFDRVADQAAGGGKRQGGERRGGNADGAVRGWLKCRAARRSISPCQ